MSCRIISEVICRCADGSDWNEGVDGRTAASWYDTVASWALDHISGSVVCDGITFAAKKLSEMLRRVRKWQREVWSRLTSRMQSEARIADCVFAVQRRKVSDGR